MDTSYEKYEVKPKDLKFRAPDRNEAKILENGYKITNSVAKIFYVVFALFALFALSTTIGAVMSGEFVGAISGMLGCVVLIAIFVYMYRSKSKKDFGIFYCYVVDRYQKYDHDRLRKYVDVWNEDSSQFCRRISYPDSNNELFEELKPGDVIMVVKINDSMITAVREDLFYQMGSL